MEFPPKGKYRHFKGNEYELLYIGKHSETGEYLVVYKALYKTEGDGIWIRPLTMWNDMVERDGRTYKRFTYIGDDAAETPCVSEDKPVNADIYGILKTVYGYTEFRQGQENVINSILSGRDTLGVMPTGAGKSICYQIPALALPGVTIVISPLISLMKDQVAALIRMGVPAAYINTSLTEGQISIALNRAAEGAYKIMYVAPERLLTDRFMRLANAMNISLIAIDEAHCISQWGQDFRPAYLDIPKFIAALPRRPRLCAFTATATQKVRDDIKTLTGLINPFELVTGFDRPNLYFEVVRPENKNQELLRRMRTYGDMSGIVYCSTRKQVEDVTELLVEHGINATRYHAGLSEEERRENQEAFTMDEIPIMVATNAFGMGIDKSNVRFVIHYNMPKDPESYYQEAGRAGRDGERSDCVLMYSVQDIVTQNFFIDHLGEGTELAPDDINNLKNAARARLRAMKEYSTSGTCLRAHLLSYFGEKPASRCGFCSNCDQRSEMADVTALALVIESCVKAVKGSYGIAMVKKILRGSREERIIAQRLDELPMYGALKEYEESAISDIIDALLDKEILRRSDGEYATLRLGKNFKLLENGELRIKLGYTPAVGKQKREKKETRKHVYEDESGLLDALKQKRKEIAKRLGFLPYMVFSDATLIEMTKKRPRTLRELLDVNGVGDKKLHDFGKEFLETINGFKD